MAILRSGEIREMEDSEMDDHLSQIRKNLMKIRGVLASGGIPEEVGKAGEMKKTIARILTEKRSREVKTKK